MRILALILTAVLFAMPAAAQTPPAHGIAMHGDLKYPHLFTHFDYANAHAPKGGAIRLAASGTFDSLNPYILKGMSAPGLGMVYQTLMMQAEDEAFSEYGLIAESAEVPPDRSRITFNLRPSARWNDGQPLTADDVVFSFHTLMEKGHPFYRAYYADVAEAKAESPQRVTFVFKNAKNRELPLIMGQMPILPKHFWEGKDFSRSSLEKPLGSGPYRVAAFDAGKRITYERVQDWWAKDLPVTKGFYNFDTITYDLYRDETVLLQAFFAGSYDFRHENIAKAWSVEYDTPPVRDGLIQKEEVHHSIPAGMQAFALNARRALFADPRVREALGLAFDFEWSNRQFAFGTYKRTQSYFANSELAATGVPEGLELGVLEPFRGQVPDAVFTTPFAVPKTSGNGTDIRIHLTQAKKLLADAGWKLGPSGLLEKDGRVFRFEFLFSSPAFERWTGPMVANLKKLGIEATMRTVDAAQYQKRMDSFDYDVTVATFGQSLSPGNEQRDFWTSAKADIKGSRNLMGIKNPVVDALVEKVVAAATREDLIAATRALDRVLLWNYYVIPQWHIDYHRLAWWDKFGRPAVSPKYGLGAPETWWFDAQKAARIDAKVKPDAK